MRISWHIAFSKENAPQLTQYIESHNVPHSLDQDLYSFDIYEDNEHWEYIHNEVLHCKVFRLANTHFTKSELSNADWLRVRSTWRFGYPQPQGTFFSENSTYKMTGRCPACGIGQEQVDAFRMNQVPNWGRRHFGELNWIGDELFADDIAKDILTTADISGIVFDRVKNKNGQLYMASISQLKIPNILAPGLVEDTSIIRKVSICPACGTKKYLLGGIGKLTLKKSIFDNAPMAVKTAEFFGDGMAATRINIVHQYVYQTIVSNNLDRGLVFEPIELQP